MTNLRFLAVATMGATALAGSSPASAAEVVTITGGLYFQSLFGPNYFDPANKYVPARNPVTPELSDAFFNARSNTLPLAKFPYFPNAVYGVFAFQDLANLDYARIIIEQSTTSLIIRDIGKNDAFAFFMVLQSNLPIFLNPGAATNYFPGSSYSVLDSGKTFVFSAPYFASPATREFFMSFTFPKIDIQPAPISSGRQTLAALAAPEPASWAMMVLGFGAIGATMRRRQRITVTYA